MKQYTKYIALGLITLFAIIATFSSLYYPPLNNKEYNFHTKNVVDDIAVIAQTPHSVEHPNERAEVRDYLVKRLKEMGGNFLHPTQTAGPTYCSLPTMIPDLLKT